MTTDNANMEVMKRKFNVQTNIKTLKKVWNLFDELGISNLILGKQVEIKPDLEQELHQSLDIYQQFSLTTTKETILEEVLL